MNNADLLDVCEQTGVILGSFDRRVVKWVGSFDPGATASLCGIIARAHRDGWEAAMKAAGEDSGQ